MIRYKRCRRLLADRGQLLPWLLVALVTLLSVSVQSAYTANNLVPRFVSPDGSQGSEIVVLVKEGPGSVGKEIARLAGEDADGDALTFGVVGTIGADILDIQNVPNNAAIVYLRKELDRETRDSYSIVLTLTDGKLGKGNFITKSMLIIVEDTNDNEPVFRPFKTTVSMSEDSRPGIVESVEAFDPDEGRFGEVLYKLQEVDKEPGPETFAIETVDGRGVISLISRLDYERKSSYHLRILAIDRAVEGERKTATAMLLVRVEDADDEPPIFTLVPSVTRVPENLAKNTQVLRVAAVDGDRGVNNAIAYRIVKGDRGLFAIDANSGVVTVIGVLDRETAMTEGSERAVYILEIEARELTSVVPAPSVTTEVTIILTDINDQKPEFRSAYYVAEISENAPADTPIKFVGAGNVPQVYDHDQGANGTFRLSLEGEYARFFTISPMEAINEATFVIKTQTNGTMLLDYEKTTSVRLTVVAREKLKLGSQTSSVQVTVHIKDENDNKPLFEQPLYKASVPENVAQGTVIAKIKATDADTGIFGTAGIRYTEVRGEIANKLTLDPITGLLSVKTADGFDREASSQYQLVIEARDNNGTGNRNTVLLVLSLEDVNDNEPVFKPFRTTVTVPEDSRPGVIETVEAYDPDLGQFGQVAYSLTELDKEPGPETFSIENVDGRGVISLMARLDYEKKSLYHLRILATDRAIEGERRTAVAALIVRVGDAEDEPPVFTVVPSVNRIPENLPPQTQILRVAAVDGDRGINNPITYRIVRGDRGLFAIDLHTGVVSVIGKIDRETALTEGAGSAAYILEIEAREESAISPQPSAKTEVTIIVTDVNDERPLFRSAYYVAEINENSPAETPIKFIGAGNVPQVYDHDQGANGTFTLSLEGQYARFFEVSPTEGVNEATFAIRVKDGFSLDYETLKSMQFKIIAREKFANSQASSAAQVTVHVKDANDNAPVFEQQLYKATVPENISRGTLLAIFRATDVDTGIFGTAGIRYTEVRGEVASKLSLDPISGRLTVKTADGFDREASPTYQITIEARDNNGTGNRNTVQLLLTLDDVNDNSPVFKSFRSTVTIPENSLPGLVETVEAYDPDLGQFGEVLYRLIEVDKEIGPETFTIETIEGKGVINLVSRLDYERKSSYHLRILAIDRAIEGERRTATAMLLVRVEDAEDEPPIFTLVPSVTRVPEDLPVLSQVLRVAAVDGDRGVNNAISYRIIKGARGLFSINSSTGVVSVAANLDREASISEGAGNAAYILEIQATEVTSVVVPPPSVTTEVIIEVKDVNDNAPQFAKKVFTGGVTTEADFGTVFMQVKASDADAGMNSLLSYYISSPIKRKLSVGLDAIKSDPFLVNRRTGEISLNFDPQRDMKGYFEFEVLANDTDGLSDTARVYIYLLREDQRVRFVLRLAPQELREKLEKFMDVLANITQAIVNVDSYKFYENEDGTVDKGRTVLYLHFVNPNDNSIMEVENVLTLIDKNHKYLNELYQEFHVLLGEPSVGTEEYLAFEDQVKAALVGSTAFLALLLLLITCLCLNQRTKYKRQLKAATVTAFGPRDTTQLTRANVPNTNIHADEGSNPIWMTGYDNEWYDKDDEQISHDSGGNSLDENAVGEATTTEPTTPTDSLNGSARGSNSSINDRQALCRGIGGRLTPNNIVLPQKGRPVQGKKPAAPRPPGAVPSKGGKAPDGHEVTCKNSINTVYISSSYPNQSQHSYHPHQLGNNLSIINLETTEL